MARVWYDGESAGESGGGSQPQSVCPRQAELLAGDAQSQEREEGGLVPLFSCERPQEALMVVNVGSKSCKEKEMKVEKVKEKKELEKTLVEIEKVAQEVEDKMKALMEVIQKVKDRLKA
jgi:hypothetical protein